MPGSVREEPILPALTAMNDEWTNVDLRRRRWLGAAAAASLGACAPAPLVPEVASGMPVSPTPSPPAAPPVDWASYRIPGEFEPQRAVWLGYDSGLADMSAALARALAPHTALKFLVPDEDAAAQARAMVRRLELPVDRIAFHLDPQAMYYLRDAAVFVTGAQRSLGVIDLRWSQYGMPGWCRRRYAADARRAASCVQEVDTSRDALDRGIARLCGAPVFGSALHLEGGGIESNGQGVLIACEALVRQRNPDLDRAQLERLHLALPGVRRVIWLPDGLAEDPQQRGTILGDYVAWGTGGHTDEFVRFADAQTVLLAWPDDAEASSHPVARLNRQRMQRNAQILAASRAADGQALRILRVPMPRIVERRVTLARRADERSADEWSADFFAPAERRREGSTVIQVAAASYLNFVIANGVVVLPDYLPHGTPRAVQDRVQAIFEQAFPGRVLRWVDALALNWLGGGPHCATLHEPLP